MALDQWEDKELITKAKMNAMVDAINENTDGVAQGGGSVKSVNGVSPDSKGNVNTPKTDLSGYATKESVTNAQNTANSAQAAVDGLEIDDRNYATNTSDQWTVVANASNYTTRLLNDTYPIDDPGQYIARVYIKPESHDAHIWVNYMDSADATGTKGAGGNIIKAGTEGYSSVIIRNAYNKLNVQISFADKQSDETTVSYKRLKVTKGKYNSDWTPNPEDKADDAKVGHLANDQTWVGVNNFNNLQINGQNIDAYIAAQIAKATGTA